MRRFIRVQLKKALSSPEYLTITSIAFGQDRTAARSAPGNGMGQAFSAIPL
jgi:hypothetical protein